jgi:hypothetical protein
LQKSYPAEADSADPINTPGFNLTAIARRAALFRSLPGYEQDACSQQPIDSTRTKGTKSEIYCHPRSGFSLSHSSLSISSLREA